MQRTFLCSLARTVLDRPNRCSGIRLDMSSEVEALKKQIAELTLKLKEKEGESNLVAPYSKSLGRTEIAKILSTGKSLAGKTLRIGGWVKTGREAGAGAWCFLEINDGSCFSNLQALVTKEVAEAVGGLGALTTTGTSVVLEGELTPTPEGVKQAVELKATKVVHVGPCDGGQYPMAKQRLPVEFLREKIHLRPRTNLIGAVARIRNALAYATHTFFQNNGFKYVHTPIITASDCEGAGEMFQVTTLLSKAEELAKVPRPSQAEVEAAKNDVNAKGEALRALKESAKSDPSAKAGIPEAVAALNAAKQHAQEVEERSRAEGGIARTATGEIDYANDFFGKKAYLTVSGQLEGEVYACALSNIYTFGPTFRAENSNTTRHLAEFWMIEPEMAFADLYDDMQCAEDYVRFCCNYLLDNCMEDMEFMKKQVDPNCIDRLRQVGSSPFKRVSYTEAIEILEGVVRDGKKKFEYPVSWGIDMQSEHERYLTEEVFKQPIIVYNYPKEIKAFYMKLNEDGKTVAAMDVLVPKVGELIGGSQREDRLEVLEQKIRDMGMDLGPYSGYLDLRRFGSVPHAGFGLGFERLILFSTGLDNIREAIPFPRWPMHAT